MPVALPFTPTDPPTPHYRVSVQLDGATYLFDVRWNGRAGAWFLDIFTADETPLARGVKVVLGAVLARRVISERWPGGILVANDASGEGREAGYDDFGTRVLVYFYTFEEIAELRA